MCCVTTVPGQKKKKKSSAFTLWNNIVVSEGSRDCSDAVGTFPCNFSGNVFKIQELCEHFPVQGDQGFILRDLSSKILKKIMGMEEGKIILWLK